MSRIITRFMRSDNLKVQIGNLGASVLGLISFMILARALSLTEFGNWSIFMSVSGLIELIRSGLSRQAMVRALSIGKTNRLAIIASTLTLQLAITGLLILLTVLVKYFFKDSLANYSAFLTWYPALVVVSIPMNMGTWIAQADRQFTRMNLLRFQVNILFVAGILIGYFLDFTMEQYLLHLVISNLIVSLASTVRDNYFKSLFYAKWKVLKELFSFGKHNLATLAGANLLKSSDALLVGTMLGADAVAIYAIPMKIIDLLDIPLRGFVMVSFAKLSRLFNEGQVSEFSSHVFRMTFALVLTFLPIAIVFLAFPQLPILILGGSEYAEATGLLQIFVFAMILLPADKYVGVAFDSSNQPGQNAFKVWLMLTLNIIGDALAIYFIGDLWAVALVTVVNILLGVIYGVMVHPLLKMENFKSWIQEMDLRNLTTKQGLLKILQ